MLLPSFNLLQSIWQFFAIVVPPSFHGVMWLLPFFRFKVFTTMNIDTGLTTKYTACSHLF